MKDKKTKPDAKWKPQNILYQGHVFSSQPENEPQQYLTSFLEYTNNEGLKAVKNIVKFSFLIFAGTIFHEAIPINKHKKLKHKCLKDTYLQAFTQFHICICDSHRINISPLL